MCQLKITRTNLAFNLIIKLVILLALAMGTSCQHEYDTKLNGRWQLRNEFVHEAVYVVDTIYYSFDNRVLLIQKKQKGYFSEVFGRFTQQEDSLLFEFPDYPTLTNLKYQIAELSSTTLQLKNEQHVLLFRKF